MKYFIVIAFLCFSSQSFGSKISEGFKALSIYDYFKAKQLFYKCLNKHPSASAFGLATIYLRTDNPFTNIDSAAKYISISKNQFKDTITYSSYHITNSSIDFLIEKIGLEGFKKYSGQNSVDAYNHFLMQFYFSDSTLLEQAFYKRDELEFSKVLATQSSEQITAFLLQYPQTTLYKKAKKIYYDFQFVEEVPDKSCKQYQLFIKQFPNNPNIEYAEICLFNLIQRSESADSIYNFITNYSTILTKEKAWKLLYGINVKKYNKEDMTNFLHNYPDYPFNESVTKEISLAQTILLPIKNTQDKFGFIDTTGNWVIKAQYDDAAEFKEGVAAVCKNDSCFFIDKEGKITSTSFYDETESYTDGIAIVKKDSVYFLLNRLGQIISKGYQDINAASNNLFVCKLNDLYGAINSKGEIIIPFTYNKLGNFKNNYAYYIADQYGLVDINNKTLNAHWEWVSDVDSNLIIVVKKNNKFGLMSVDESLILPVDYDYITNCQNEIYLLVKNNLYGFYNVKDKCFITALAYNYNSSFAPSYYTNEKYFKLIKDDEVALVDANGRYSINFGIYTNLFFAKCDIIRIQKNNKYGFVDRKLKGITAVEYDKAFDYLNNLAITYKGNVCYLLNKTGGVTYSIIDGEIKTIANSLFEIKLNNLYGLLDQEGKPLLNPEYESIVPIYKELYTCVKNDGIYLFNSKTKALTKI
jgi:hypothetical protein